MKDNKTIKIIILILIFISITCFGIGYLRKNLYKEEVKPNNKESEVEPTKEDVIIDDEEESDDEEEKILDSKKLLDKSYKVKDLKFDVTFYGEKYSVLENDFYRIKYDLKYNNKEIVKNKYLITDIDVGNKSLDYLSSLISSYNFINVMKSSDNKDYLLLESYYGNEFVFSLDIVSLSNKKNINHFVFNYLEEYDSKIASYIVDNKRYKVNDNSLEYIKTTEDDNYYYLTIVTIKNDKVSFDNKKLFEVEDESDSYQFTVKEKED